MRNALPEDVWFMADLSLSGISLRMISFENQSDLNGFFRRFTGLSTLEIDKFCSVTTFYEGCTRKPPSTWRSLGWGIFWMRRLRTLTKPHLYTIDVRPDGFNCW